MPAPRRRKQSPPKSSAASEQCLSLVLGAGISFPCRADTPGAALPRRILIAKWGENEARSQGKTFFVGDHSVAEFPKEQAKRGWDTVSMDYEHQSVPGYPTYKPDPREMAAHGHIEVTAGQGIHYVVDRYTPSGDLHAPNYPDVSGLFIIDPTTREVVAVHSVALCQHGEVQGAEFKESVAASAILSPNASPASVEQCLAYCRDLLDLGDDSMPEDIAAGLQELVRAKNTGDPAEAAEADTQDTDVTTPTQDIPIPMADPTKPGATAADPNAVKAAQDRLDALTSTVEKLVGVVNTMAASQAATAHNTAVEAEFRIAASQGKKIPEGLKLKSDAGLYVIAAAQAKDILAAIPVTEAVEFLTPEFLAASSGGAMATSQYGVSAQDEALVCANLGITKDKLKAGSTIIHANAPAPKSALAAKA